ncbi:MULTISPECIES: hypothetical protein [Planktothricoides]|uniref:Uncharacterized protein n=2 Tax=Planktothricoides raciborskii TaxID=132608 RepID=A0AAU8JAP2_9CYAN|nr:MULTISPECIES: hypothetical protein [Planktothricoides]MBD2543002.1 hypothetical protein [Planktothricoides raciborskii FACHB-1370]MBD2581881.1 hypothetical protein [Planktothricoides raciborskii FACHB-1261]
MLNLCHPPPETGFLQITFATNPRNRVSLDHRKPPTNKCHRNPVSCPGFFPRFLCVMGNGWAIGNGWATDARSPFLADRQN